MTVNLLVSIDKQSIAERIDHRDASPAGSRCNVSLIQLQPQRPEESYIVASHCLTRYIITANHQIHVHIIGTMGR